MGDKQKKVMMVQNEGIWKLFAEFDGIEGSQKDTEKMSCN